MKWVQLTKRTNDPKLQCLQFKLRDAGIESRRNGESWHAPILQVMDKDLDRAWEILNPIDEISDDDPRWYAELSRIVAINSNGFG